MTDDNREPRLPPPAFPPGQRRHLHRSANHEGTGSAVDAGAREDVTPLPYDPIELAFISPDDPLPARTLTVANEPEADDDPGIEDGEEGEVVGMDLDAHAHTEDRDVSKYDPHVMELTDVLARLAESLRRHGEVGLQPSPSMTRLEATLRAYCTGYLAGRRTHAKPPAVEVSE